MSLIKDNWILEPGLVSNLFHDSFECMQAYKKLGPLQYPEPGSLQGPWEHAEVFKELELVHTNVVHKRKPGQTKAQYTKQFNVRSATGTEYTVVGGIVRNRKKKKGLFFNRLYVRRHTES